MAGAGGRPPRLPGRHDRDHARWRREVPLRRGRSAAVRRRRFSQAHPTTVLVTVDLGFNDLLALPAPRGRRTRPASTGSSPWCTTSSRRSSTGIEAAAPPAPASSASGTTTPTSGTIFRGSGGQAFAMASLNVMERLDATLRSDYAAAGSPSPTWPQPSISGIVSTCGGPACPPCPRTWRAPAPSRGCVIGLRSATTCTPTTPVIAPSPRPLRRPSPVT